MSVPGPAPARGSADAAGLLGLLRRADASIHRLSRLRAWLLVVAWMAGISWLSSWRAGDVTDLADSGLLTNLGHAPLFGILAMWLALALARGASGARLDAGAVVRVVGLVALFGVLDEAHQHFAGRGRDFSLLDVVTDVTGAVCLLLIAAYARRPDATGGGLSARLAAGVGACLAAAAAATWLPDRWPDAGWL